MRLGLVLLGLALNYIRHRRIAGRWRCMLLITATTAIVFRLLLAIWATLGSSHWFETFYACDARVGWLLPLVARGWCYGALLPSL